MIRKNLILALFLAITLPVLAQDADLSMIPYRQGNLWGYATPDKIVVIKPTYESADLFYEGYAAVKKGGKYGYINKDGKLVIAFKYFSATRFRTGYFEKKGAKSGDADGQTAVLFAGAAPASNGVEICIDNKGVTLPKCPAIGEVSSEEKNIDAGVTVTKNYSTIQKTDLYDKITDDYKMPGAEDSYYIAVRSGKYGVFNKTFDVIVPFEYDKIEKINMGVMGYLIVEKDGLKGMTFGNGSLFMAVENTKIQYVQASDGANYIIFTKDGKTGLKSSKYKMIAEPKYHDIVYDPAGGFILTGDDNLKGAAFLNYNVIEPKYAEVSFVKGGNFVLVKTKAGEPKEPGGAAISGKSGYISKNLVEFFED